MMIPSRFLPHLTDNDVDRKNPADTVPGVECVVRLYAAPLPKILGRIAVHCWFGALPAGDTQWQRWEVWQTRNAGGTSWGHVHKNLKNVDRGVGGGKPFVRQEWTGDDAERILAVLQEPESYPHKNRYWAFPGPNSNTYVAWVLRQAGVTHRLGVRALGALWPLGRVTPDLTRDV